MTSALLLAMGAALAPPGQASDAIPPERFQEFLTLIKPAPEESLWSSIPWMGDLTRARRKAAAEGKPLYVWTMAGEPLGMC